MDYVEKLPKVRRAEDTQGESIRVREQELEGLESHRSSTLDHKTPHKEKNREVRTDEIQGDDDDDANDGMKRVGHHSQSRAQLLLR